MTADRQDLEAALAEAEAGFAAVVDARLPKSVQADSRSRHRPSKRRATENTPTPLDAPATTLRLTPASTITVRPVQWLWEGRIALGTLALVAGREGIGKSILVYTLAADITRGRMAGAYHGQPRAVIVAATEDSWEHTIVPRLMAAGADLSRVYRVDAVTSDLVDTAVSLPRDLVALEQAIQNVGAAAVVLDPLLSRLDSGLDTHKDAEVRLALEPLVALAGATDAAVIGLIHVNKTQSSDALTLLMGSRAFAAVARSVLYAMTDPDDEGRRLLGTPKNNLGRTDLPTLAFRIVGEKVADTSDGEVWTGRLQWDGEADRSIAEALAETAMATGDRTATSEAADWLLDYLNAQPDQRCESAAAKRDGAKDGHSREALRRACGRLGVVTQSSGFPRRSYWSLPSSSRHSAGRQPSTVSTGATVSTGQGRHIQRESVNRQSTQSTQSTQSPTGPPRARSDQSGQAEAGSTTIRIDQWPPDGRTA